MRHGLKVLIVLSLLCPSACRNSALDSSAQTAGDEIRSEAQLDAPPFPTKEPEKYQANIVFSFKFSENAENAVEQATFTARDGAQRRLDFEIGDGKKVSRLVAADGKQFVLLPEQKVYAEISGGENFIKNAPDDVALEHLLYAKPIGAKYERIGAEEIAGRQTTKYRLVFDKSIQTGNTSTETIVWADEKLGLPIRTEISALVDGKLSGAKSTTELREIKTETDAQTFALPSGYRKISRAEMQDLIRPK